MKKLIYGSLVIASIGIGVIGCKKEKNPVLKRTQGQTAKFDSFDALDQKLKELEEMSDEERRTFENKNNYKSLYSYLYEVYAKIDLEELTDVNELHRHVESNKEILEIIKIENGESEYRPIYSDNRFSLVAHENRMIIIGDQCLKIFDDGVIFAPIGHFADLNNCRSKIIDLVPLNKKFNVIKLTKIEIQAKSNCGTIRQNETTSGNNRTRIELECYAKLISGIIPTGEAFGRIRALKRTLGVWVHAQRTINGRFNFNFAFEQNGNSTSGIVGSGLTINVPIDEIVNPTHGFSVTRTIPLPTGGFYPANYRFSSINSFGDTPSTNNVSINCN